MRRISSFKDVFTFKSSSSCYLFSCFSCFFRSSTWSSLAPVSEPHSELGVDAELDFLDSSKSSIYFRWASSCCSNALIRSCCWMSGCPEWPAMIEVFPIPFRKLLSLTSWNLLRSGSMWMYSSSVIMVWSIFICSTSCDRLLWTETGELPALRRRLALSEDS